jgi:hypothetical protein
MNSVDITAFTANDDAEYTGNVASIALDCRRSGRCARWSAAGATVALTAASRQGANLTATVA